MERALADAARSRAACAEEKKNNAALTAERERCGAREAVQYAKLGEISAAHLTCLGSTPVELGSVFRESAVPRLSLPPFLPLVLAGAEQLSVFGCWLDIPSVIAPSSTFRLCFCAEAGLGVAREVPCVPIHQW